MILDLIQYIYYIGGFSLKLGSNATRLSKNATFFFKGLSYILRNSGLCAKSFYKYCLVTYCSVINPQRIYCMNWCLFKLHIFKILLIFQTMNFLQRVVAYIEEWCSLCKVILPVLFANLFFFHFLQRTCCVNLECTWFKELLRLLGETPVQRCRLQSLYVLKAMLARFAKAFFTYHISSQVCISGN